MLRIDEYSMDQLVRMRNELIDRVNFDYADEIKKDDPCAEVYDIVSDYNEISDEIVRRERIMGSMSSKCSSDRMRYILSNYPTDNFMTEWIERIKLGWYSYYHDYRTSMF